MNWGIIGSMAWLFDDDGLHIVRFSLSEHMLHAVEMGKTFSTRKHESYASSKRRVDPIDIQ